VPKSRRLAEWFSAVLLILCIAVALSAQSKGIAPALLAKAKAGDVESQWLVGSAYEDTRHYTDAVVWLRKAAASGNVLAQDHLAYLYDQGNGVPQDDAQAAFWLRKAAEEGDSYAQFQLGVLYSGGNGVPQDDERAAFWWRKAAAQGDVDAQNALAQLETKTTAGLEKLLGRKVTRADQPNAPTAALPVVPPPGFQLMDKQTPQDVIASLLPEAKAGDSEAERRVGIAYEDESAYSQAAFWIRKAAESGDAEAQYKLGHLYSEGHGVPQDNNLAAVWWRKAADQGNANAQSNLGLAYINGDGVPNDFSEAAFWLRRSAEQGDAHGQALLSMLYEAGWGVPKDYAQAAAWTRKAAEQGDSAAQGHLGDMYFNGQGVPQDFALAKFWYSKAASQGDANAQNALEQLNSKLAAIEAEQKRRRDRIAVFALCLVLLGAVTFTAIRLRKKLIGYGRRLYPHNFRSRQLAVLLLVGCWCSACCLIQVLSRQAMHHPVNAAVTALLWAIPGLILGAVCMWWLSHPLAENGPVPTPARPEPANLPTERALEGTELVAIPQTSYRWGKFQGWTTLVYGIVLLVGALLSSGGDSWSNAGLYAGVVYTICLGYGLIKKYNYGLILFYAGIPLDILATALVFYFGLLSFNFASVIAVALVLAWSVIPAIFYYPKRRKEFSRSSSKVALREAPQATDPEPKEARTEEQRFYGFRLGEVFVKRSRFVVGWFVLLFLFNFIARTEAGDGHPIIERSLEAVEYFFAPIEIIASLVALAILFRLSRK